MVKLSDKKINSIFKRYHNPSYLVSDPLSLVRNYKKTPQLESVAFVTALLSYGRVSQIIKTMSILLERANNNILSFISETSLTQKLDIFDGIKHRFNTGADIAVLCEAIKPILKEYGSLKGLFYSKDSNYQQNIIYFVSTIKKEADKFRSYQSRNFAYLLSNPSGTSACKRLHMYFRWMIRQDDGIDLGLWHQYDTAKLIMPIDAHILKVSHYFGLTKRKNSDRKAAEEITVAMQKFDRNDPVRFDFSLCRFGMFELRNKKI